MRRGTGRFPSILSLSVCLIVGASGCSSTPPFATVEPTIESFESFALPLQVNDHGVATVAVQTSAGPLQLILDTGADQALLLRTDAPVAAHLKRVGSQTKWYANGKLDRTAVLGIPELTLGPLKYTNVRAPLESTEFPQFMPGDGVLGRGLLGNMTLDIDLPGKRLGLLPPGSLPRDFRAQDWIEVPLLAYDNGPVVPVQIDNSTHTLRMVMDTGAIATGSEGSYGVVELPSDLSPTADKVDGLPVYRAQTIHIGAASLGAMNLFVVKHPQPPGTHGFLGNVLYTRHRVLIVPATKTVYLSRVTP